MGMRQVQLTDAEIGLITQLLTENVVHGEGSAYVFTDRLRGVVVEQRPALELIAQHDRPETLHYVDPPYVLATRSGITNRGPKSRHGYRHEMTDEDHRTLALALHGVKGMVVLSGYNSELYGELYGEWQRHERATFADKAKPRIESLWLNPTCAASLAAERAQGHLPLVAP